MPKDEKKKNRVEKMLDWIMNHKIFSVPIALFIVVGAVLSYGKTADEGLAGWERLLGRIRPTTTPMPTTVETVIPTDTIVPATDIVEVFTSSETDTPIAAASITTPLPTETAGSKIQVFHLYTDDVSLEKETSELQKKGRTWDIIPNGFYEENYFERANNGNSFLSNPPLYIFFIFKSIGIVDARWLRIDDYGAGDAYGWQNADQLFTNFEGDKDYMGVGQEWELFGNEHYLFLLVWVTDDVDFNQPIVSPPFPSQSYAVCVKSSHKQDPADERFYQDDAYCLSDREIEGAATPIPLPHDIIPDLFSTP